MILYTMVIILSIAGTLLYKKSNNKMVNKLLFSMIVIMISLISGLRPENVGTDTAAYIRTFYEINSSSLNIFSYKMEPLFVLLNKGAYLIYPSHQILLIIASLISTSLILKTYFRYSQDISLSVFLFFTSYIFYQSLNGLRQYIAIAILVYSVRFIFDRKAVKFVIAILISTGFHSTAVIFLPIYFLFGKANKQNLKKVLVLLVLSFTSFFLLPFLLRVPYFIFEQYRIYLDSIFNNSGGIRDLMVSVIIILFIIVILITKTKSLEKRSWFFIYMAIFYFTFSLYGLRLDSSLSQRIGWYFSVFIPLLLPEMLLYVKKNNTVIYYYFLVITYVSIHYYLLYSNFHRVLPYMLGGI